MDRLEILRQARKLAYDAIDACSALSDEVLAALRPEFEDDEEQIIWHLADQFLNEAELDIAGV